MNDHIQDHHLLETILASSKAPVSINDLTMRLPADVNIHAALQKLDDEYQDRALQVVEVAGGWTLRTRPEHSDLCRKFLRKPIKLSNAALETLVIIALFQPVTRPEIERIRGVTMAKAILDLLLWSEWVRPGPRRQTPGNPLTFVATNKFLQQFDFKSFEDLPDIKTLREAGILNAEKDLGITLPDSENDINEA